jgi:hypothetical protein
MDAVDSLRVLAQEAELLPIVAAASSCASLCLSRDTVVRSSGCPTPALSPTGPCSV